MLIDKKYLKLYMDTEIDTSNTKHKLNLTNLSLAGNYTIYRITVSDNDCYGSLDCLSNEENPKLGNLNNMGFSKVMNEYYMCYLNNLLMKKYNIKNFQKMLYHCKKYILKKPEEYFKLVSVLLKECINLRKKFNSYFDKNLPNNIYFQDLRISLENFEKFYSNSYSKILNFYIKECGEKIVNKYISACNQDDICTIYNMNVVYETDVYKKIFNILGHLLEISEYKERAKKLLNIWCKFTYSYARTVLMEELYFIKIASPSNFTKDSFKNPLHFNILGLCFKEIVDEICLNNKSLEDSLKEINNFISKRKFKNCLKYHSKYILNYINNDLIDIDDLKNKFKLTDSDVTDILTGGLKSNG